MAKLTFVIKCPDQPGIIAGVTHFIKENGGNIVYIDQYVDRENLLFFMRLEASFEELSASFYKQFEESISNKFEMNCEIFETNRRPRMAVFVSKYDHCLYDLLSQYKSGELCVDIPFVLSNHEDLKEATGEQFNEFVIFLEDNQTKSPLPKKISIDVPNNHLKYAITWYAISISIIFYYLYFRRKK